MMLILSSLVLFVIGPLSIIMIIVRHVTHPSRWD
jgi:hypothetical protein